MTTIRGLMLAQQARHRVSPSLHGWCWQCEQKWPCVDRVAADAVLATLSDAAVSWIPNGSAHPVHESVRTTGRYRLVLDPPDPGVS